MSDKPLSFKERMELAKKNTTLPAPTVEEKTEPVAEKKSWLSNKPKAPAADAVAVEDAVEEKVADLPRVIMLANEANKIVPQATEGELLAREIPDNVYILKQKIASLSEYSGIDLRREMDDLRNMLRANPEACMYFLPEDTGLLVRALRKITDNKVAADMGSTRTSKKAAEKATMKPLSAAELQAALDDL